MSTYLDIREILQGFARENFGVEGEVIKLSKEGDQWVGELELTRDDDYRRKHGRPQLVERYEVRLNEEDEIVSFERVETRSRGDVEWKREE